VSHPETYSLLTESWLPVLDTAGGTRSVSLLEAFADASVIERLVGDVPGQEPALLRLLLAILHRAVDGPADLDSWRDLWDADQLPTDRIEAYLQRWADAFELFHPVSPFFQVAGLSAKSPPEGLANLFPKTSGAVPVFSRYPQAVPTRLDPATAARWLVHLQAWDAAGIKTGALGDPNAPQGRSYGNRVGPLGLYGVIVARGRTLRDTLLLNLLPAEEIDADADDRPCWESGPLTAVPQERRPRGLLDLYTWQSRRVRLFPTLSQDGLAVTAALVCGGDRFDVHDVFGKDPHTGWRRSQPQEKKLKRIPVYLPAAHRPDRQVWRGLTTMLPAVTTSAGGEPAALLPPLLLSWLGALTDAGLLDGRTTVGLGAYGCHYGQQSAVVEDTLTDDLPVALAVLRRDAPATATLVDGCAHDAAAAADALRTLAANLTRAAGSRDEEQARAVGNRLAESLYHHLDGPFRALLRQANSLDPLHDRQRWQQALRHLANRLADQVVAAAPTAAFTGRAYRGRHLTSVTAEAWYRSRLARDLPLAHTSTQGDAA
jgi:CRISPR system Cascade subunit CasA